MSSKKNNVYFSRNGLFIIACFVLSIFISTNCFSENTGADFLKIGIGARPVGLGNVFTAIANDVTAMQWNVGGLAQLTQREVSAMHSQWLADTNLDYIGFAVPLITQSPNHLISGVMGGSVIYLSQGELEGRDANRQLTNSFGASDMALTFSYSKVIARNKETKQSQGSSLMAGINMKIIQQKIETEHATGIAFDVGILSRLFSQDGPFSAGLSIQNIGPQMKFISEGYNLPLTVTTGLGYNIGGVTVGLDVKQQVYENRTIISFGTEFLPISSLALRAGYASNFIASSLNSSMVDSSGIGAGFGIKLFGTQTDYSFVPYGALGNTHRISFSSKF
ncbi:MAG: hypothetical protein A2252_07955 [Elusimicrobia bacterium RIFOXYA2_FULL_39_19]|nr:MAG: hypothetical protein A2252_07955 [Elusimicrobia bacterium RIFOXYA2_FULL_39_19]